MNEATTTSNPEVPTRKHPLWLVWRGMVSRCTDPRHKSFVHYGARGITVCDRWRDFYAFVQDIPARPSKKHTLDRYPNKNGNYEPGNVRWATQSEQLRNQSRNRLLTHDGVTMCLAEWVEATGISKGVIAGRLKLGWPADRILTTPVRAIHRYRA